MSDRIQIYVIGGRRGPQKIGVSFNPELRVTQLQTSSPIKLSVRHQNTFTGDALLVERVAHKLLAAKRLNGEWFNVKLEEAIAAIERAVALVEAGDLGLLERSNEQPSKLSLNVRLEIYPDGELLLRLDRWRIEQPGAPSRAEAVRRLVDEALEAKAKPAPASQSKRAKAAA